MAFNIPDVSNIDIGKLGKSNRPEPNFIPNIGSTPGANRDIYRTLTYNCGVSWSVGLMWGGLVGGMNGIKNSPGQGFKLRMNSFLNGAGTGSSNLANRFGVYALIYSGTYCAAEELNLESIAGTLLVVPGISGMVTGAGYTFSNLSKSPRAVVLGSVIGSGVSCALWIANSLLTGR